MIAFILKNWKLVLGFGCAVLLFTGALVALHRAKTAGYASCVADYDAKFRDVEKISRDSLVEVEKNYAQRIKDLQEAPEDFKVGVGVLTSRAIDGL